MSVRTEYKEGEVVGDHGVIFIKELPSHRTSGGQLKRMALFYCSCRKEFKCLIPSVISGNTQSCGCINVKKITALRWEHGLIGTSLYNRWKGIKQRCYDKKNISYVHYGGRGITMCEEWINNPKSFVDYIKTLSGWSDHKLTIDRINNDGNYEHGNLRLADRVTQKFNSRPYPVSISGYRNIYPIKNGWYIAKLGYKRKEVILGHFKTKKKALKAVNRYITENNLPHKIQIYKGE